MVVLGESGFGGSSPHEAMRSVIVLATERLIADWRSINGQESTRRSHWCVSTEKNVSTVVSQKAEGRATWNTQCG
jgi:hypothetical protein